MDATAQINLQRNVLKTQIALVKHLPGRHDQKEHGRNRKGYFSIDNEFEDAAKQFASVHPFLYHITTKDKLNSIATSGLKPSTTGYSGEGIYFGFEPADTQYNVNLSDTNALLMRVNTNLLFKLYKMGPGSVEIDEGTNEVNVTNKNAVVPPEIIEFNSNGHWKGFAKASKFRHNVVYDIEAEEKHLPGKHNQQLHAGKDVAGQKPLLDYSMLNEHMTPKQRKKFGEAVRKEYETNPRFKALADALSIYTQGSFRSIVSASNAVASGKVEEWLRFEAERRGYPVEDYMSGKGVLDGYGAMFTCKNILGDDMWGSVKVKDAINSATLIMDAIAQSPMTEQPIFRGDMINRYDLDELKEGKDFGSNIIEEIKRENRYRKGYEVELKEELAKTKPNAGAVKELKRSIERSKEMNVYNAAALREARQMQKALTVGSEFDAGILSFTHDQSVARGFAYGNIKGTRGKIDYRTHAPVVFKVTGKHNGLRVSAFSPYRQKEMLVGGRFKVKSVTFDMMTRVVELEQVNTYEVSKASR